MDPHKIGGLMSALKLVPEGEAPDPVPCSLCGDPIEHIWRSGKWVPLDDPCEACVAKAEEQEREAAQRTRQAARLKHVAANIDEALAQAGVPSRYRNCTFSNYRAVDVARKEILGIASKFAAALTLGNFKDKYGLFLGGAQGVGKTHLACAIMREAVLAGIKSRFENFPRALLQIKATFGKAAAGPDEAELIHRTARVPFLVLDDLGKETLSSWARTTTYLIVNEREFEGLPFVITSNLYLDEIAEQYDAAIASRIIGAAHVINLDRAKIKDYRDRTTRGDKNGRVD